jgi:hypothetical protein
MGSST